MEIESSVGLLSGANRGLGRAPTAELDLKHVRHVTVVADWSPRYHYAPP